MWTDPGDATKTACSSVQQHESSASCSELEVGKWVLQHNSAPQACEILRLVRGLFLRHPKVDASVRIETLDLLTCLSLKLLLTFFEIRGEVAGIVDGQRSRCPIKQHTHSSNRTNREVTGLRIIPSCPQEWQACKAKKEVQNRRKSKSSVSQQQEKGYRQEQEKAHGSDQHRCSCEESCCAGAEPA